MKDIYTMHSTRTRLLALLAVATMLAACGQAAATGPETVTAADGLAAGEEIPEPQSKTILTVKGDISESNGADGVSLDLDTIADMPMTEATVFEPFVKTDVTFTGVMLSDLLEIVGANPNAKKIFMKALDDYSVELPIAEAVASSAMLAIEENGKPIKIRHGGPARIVFLTDSKITANTDMWIWSVNRMKVNP
jgi:hypothetical protein